jgi:hypothetical protein
LGKANINDQSQVNFYSTKKAPRKNPGGFWVLFTKLN